MVSSAPAFLTRIRAAKTSDDPPRHRTRAVNLLACTRDFLKRNTIVKALGVDEEEVHDAILEVHQIITGSFDRSPAPAGTAPSPPTAHATQRCIECKGYVEIDAREGQRICTACGLVQDRSSLNFSPSFDDGSVGPPRHSQCTNVLAGVSQHVLAPCDDGEDVRSDKWRQLEHYNAYVSLGHDQLVTLDRLAKTWRGGRFNSEVRIAALLLYYPLSHFFPTDAKVRTTIRFANWPDRSNNPVVRTIHPEKLFVCGTCGTRAHTAKTARFCCRTSSWGTKRHRVW